MGNRVPGPPRPPLALVLDADSRAAVESVQSLGRHGIVVDAAAEGEALAFSSRRVRRRLRQPGAGEAEAGRFRDWLQEIERDAAYSLIIPSTERSLRQFLQLGESDPLRRKAVLPSNQSLQTGLDKEHTLKLAASLGIPTPATVVIRAGDPPPACDSYPAVLKPVVSMVEREGKVDYREGQCVWSFAHERLHEGSGLRGL
jgi:hypothetical protein